MNNQKKERPEKNGSFKRLDKIFKMYQEFCKQLDPDQMMFKRKH